jgi:hypothetical protein
MRLSNRAKGTLLMAGGALIAAAVSGQGCKAMDGSTTEIVSSAAVSKYDWMQFGGGPSHSGNNTLETQISQSNVNGLTKLFQVSLPETIEGAPVVLTGVSTPLGTHDVVYMTTRNGHLVALDAYSGAKIWDVQFSGANITMSSPAIDPSRAFIYGVGLDGKIHKVAVGNGTETTTGGWPELATLKTSVEKDGTALSIATTGGVSYLYLGAGGYDGDGGDYQGHLTTVNLGTGAQKVFNAMCSNQTIHFTATTPDCSGQKSGIWAKAGVTFDPLTNRVYIGTGNGTFSPSTFMWGDSILALNADGSGTSTGPVDSYTPSVYQTLQNNDKDLGSTNMLILPNNGSKYPHLGFQSGKDAVLRLINLDNMSGKGGPGNVAGEVASLPLITGGEVQNPCATWINPADNSTWAYVVSPSNGINAVKLSVDGGGNPSLVNQWHAGGGGGGAAVANNVVYYASNGNLHALNPTTGAQLWNSTIIGQIHWQTPAIVNGVVYIGDNGREITAYGLPGGSTGAAGSSGTGAAGSTGTGAAGASGGAGETALSRAGWTATAVPTSAGDVPANALDGNTGSRWSSGQDMANGNYYLLDMQAAHTFNELTMDSTGSANDYARGYQVFVSNDGTTFGNAIATGTGTAPVITVTFPVQTARYLKIVETAAAAFWWSITELNIYTSGSGGTGAAGSSGSGGAGSTGSGGAGSTGAGGGGAKINSGGPAIAPFVADVDFAGGGTISHANTIDTSGVTNPAPLPVYQTGRDGNFTYTVPGFTAGSSHTVRLHMCDTYWGTAGSRLFDVSINGTQVLTSFDIVGTSGAKNKALVEQFTEPASPSGTYVIQFTSVKDNSLVSGIEIQ